MRADSLFEHLQPRPGSWRQALNFPDLVNIWLILSLTVQGGEQGPGSPSHWSVRVPHGDIAAIVLPLPSILSQISSPVSSVCSMRALWLRLNPIQPALKLQNLKTFVITSSRMWEPRKWIACGRFPSIALHQFSIGLTKGELVYRLD